ncbi:MAG: alpha-L-fucosidase [Lentisphaerae bacterium]|nr:alpha-L-fucosidase [Lentisphaerota bacterium]
MSIPTPLPRVAAFEKLGFGIFVHWGLYSQWGRGEWAQCIYNVHPDEYAKWMETFTAKDFDARELARMAKEAGAKYITLTTRHHEGFSLYDTCGLNEFDAPHSPAKRDLVKEFVEACREYDIIPFFYHTTLDWKWHNKKTNELSEEEFNEYLDYLYKSVEILCSNYGKIGGLWFDGNWSRKTSDWKEDRLYKMIHRLQPDAMVINNTGLSALGAVGASEEIDSVTFENNTARPVNREGMKKYVAGEVCKTMNSHWGRSNQDFNLLSPARVIERLCQSRGSGANFLMNIGPEAQGRIPNYEKALFELVGQWMKTFGEAIYNGKPVPGVKCQGNDFMLQNGNTYYYVAMDLSMGGDKNVVAATVSGPRAVEGFDKEIVSAKWMDDGEEGLFMQDVEKKLFTIKCDPFPYGTDMVVNILKIETR